MAPIVAAFLCLLSTSLLCPVLDFELNEDPQVFGSGNSLDRIFGSAKEVIGDTLFLKADSYYHGGVKEKFEEDNAGDEHEGWVESSHETADKKSMDWIENINFHVGAHEHYHLQKNEIKEMLPFFSLATTLDPHNVEAILTTSYWLEKHFDKADEAIDLLEQSVSKNPNAWELNNALGGLYFRVKGDWVRSEVHYRAALQKAQGREVEDYLRMDMNYYLAESLDKQGRREEALGFYKQALAYFGPKNSAVLKEIILEKIGELSYNAN